MDDKKEKARRMRHMFYSAVSLLAIAAFLVLAEDFGLIGNYPKKVLNLCAVYGILGLSMNLINGFTGQFSLGQAGFMAVGAYTTTLLTLPPATKEMVFYLKPIVPWLKDVRTPFFFALLAGGLLTALIAFLVGFPVLRLRGDYLAIATLGFSEIIRVVFTNLQSITNGSTGIKGVPATANLYWNFGALAVIVALVVLLLKTSYGRAFKAIRDDDVAAEAMGISLFRHKMLSFVLSAFIAGVGGGLLASTVGAITPLLFRFTLAYDILLIVVLGGMGSVTGTVFAAFVITAAKEWLRWMDGGFSLGFVRVPPVSGLRMVVFSVLLMVVILFYRKGLFGSAEFSWGGLYQLVKSIPGWLKSLGRKRGKEAPKV